MYETPILDVINADFIKSPFKVLLDFSLSRVSKIALKFLINLSSLNDFFPILTPMFPSLSFLISAWPDLASDIAFLRSSVTEDLKKAVLDAKSGQAEIRNDKDGNIGVSIGKKSFNDDQLLKNFNAILDTLEKEKSNNILKGDLIKSAFITSTMGVSYRLKLGKNI